MADAIEFSKTLPRKITAAGALFTDASDKVLLVVPGYKDTWEIPGGVVEACESPKAACIREVKEELGITPPIGRLLSLNYREQSDELPELLLFVFDGGTLTDGMVEQIKLPADELTAFHFVTLDEAKEKVIPSLFHLIKAAISQRSKSDSVYTEHSQHLD